MTPQPLYKNNLTRDLAKLFTVTLICSGAVWLFAFTPGLSTSTFGAVVISLLCSPAIAAMERRGISRTLSIALLFTVIGAFLGVTLTWATNSILAEWKGFSAKAPEYYDALVAKISDLEHTLLSRYSFLSRAQFNISTYMSALGRNTSDWFLSHGTDIMGQLLTAVFLVPILSFVMLKDSRSLRKRIFQMVPNRFFETVFMVSSQILGAISDYLRAKLLEAFLVGFISFVGFTIVGTPYSFVLAVIAGITNIVPYVGPVIGIVPGVLFTLLDPASTHLLWPTLAVYGAANLIDTFLIFPLVVAKLVNLSPLILIAVVMVGQEYYGLVGMILSIPVAAAVKIVLKEFRRVIYGNSLTG